MKYQISFIADIAVIDVAGEVDGEGIVAAMKELILNPLFKTNMYRLWDFTNSETGELNYNSMFLLAKHFLSFPDEIKSSKVALVANTSVKHGLSRIFMALTSNSEAEISVFIARPEAEGWLQGDKNNLFLVM